MYEFHVASLKESLCPSRRLGGMVFSTVSAVIEMQDVPARSLNDRVNFLASILPSFWVPVAINPGCETLPAVNLPVSAHCSWPLLEKTSRSTRQEEGEVMIPQQKHGKRF
jgi:hypothetical protein